VAGVIKLQKQGFFSGGEKVVCVLTGHGLKDPNTAIAAVDEKPVVVPDDEAAVMDVIRSLGAV